MTNDQSERMTADQLRLYAHQIGMLRAARAADKQAIKDWRDHNRRAAELREKIGPVYQPYPHPNRALVKALAHSLREHLISRSDFSACLQNVMEKHR